MLESRAQTRVESCSPERIHLAKQMLRDGLSSIAEVATNVGYESEAAFNRAFKRSAGSPPAAWRKSVSAFVASRPLALL
ncbi:MAG: AraC family transcriptional regulator [Blastocatellia bacterium]